MDDIFEELLLYSFSFLSIGDLLRAERVCKNWKRISLDSSLWRCMSPYSFIQRAIKASENKKGVFVKMYRQAQNMWLGQCTVTTLQKSVVPILGVSKEKHLLVTGTAQKINIWNLEKMICVESLEDYYAPEGGSSKRLLTLKRGKAVFSSADNSVSVFNLVSKRRAGLLVGHTDKVSTMNWDNPTLLCTGSRDATVRFWDTRIFTSTHTLTLTDRVRGIRPLDSSSPISIVVSGNGFVSYFDIRNPQTPVEEFNVEPPEGGITGMKITADSVLYSVNHLNLYKYCLATHKTTAFIQDEVGPMCVMTCNDSTAMVGFNDGLIRAYNIETASFLYHLKVGRDYNKVICLTFDEGNLVYGLDNGIVGVCNFDKPPPKSSANPFSIPTSGTAFAATPVLRFMPEIAV